MSLSTCRACNANGASVIIIHDDRHCKASARGLLEKNLGRRMMPLMGPHDPEPHKVRMRPYERASAGEHARVGGRTGERARASALELASL